MSAFNGSGVFVISGAGLPYVSGTTISSSVANTLDSDLATGLSTCICKDGQSTPTANLTLGTYIWTNSGNAAAATDLFPVTQLQTNTFLFVAAGGTAQAITATYSPAIGTLVDGMELCARASAANTAAAPTFAPNGLTAHPITKLGGVALVAGDIYGAGHELRLRYNLANTRWELLNPAIGSVIGTTTNNNAAAGYVGEYVSSVVSSGSPVSLTTATPANVTSISLTAGDWDVSGSVGFGNSGSGVSLFFGGISNTSATFPPDTGVRSVSALGSTSTDSQILGLATTRALLSTTTTIYLVAQATFSGGSIGAYGVIEARRRR